MFTWRYLLNFFKASNMTRWFIKTLLHEIHFHCEQLIVINQHEFSIIDSHAWICSYRCLHCMSMKLEKYHLRNGAQCCIFIHLSSVSNEISSIVSFSVCWILICVIVCVLANCKVSLCMLTILILWIPGIRLMVASRDSKLQVGYSRHLYIYTLNSTQP